MNIKIGYRNGPLSSKAAIYHFAFPSAMMRVPVVSHLHQHLFVIGLDLGHSNRYVVVSRCFDAARICCWFIFFFWSVRHAGF